MADAQVDPAAVNDTLNGKSMGTGFDAVIGNLKNAPTRQDALTKEGDKVRDLQKAELGRERQKNVEFEKAHPYITPEMKPWKEKMPEPDPVKSFGSWASTFGIIASALTRRGVEGALNASASAMKAERANDLAAYADAKQAWKENTELAIKQAEWENKKNDHAFNILTKDHELGYAQIMVNAAEHQDHVAAELAKNGDWEKLGELYASRERLLKSQQDRMYAQQAHADTTEVNMMLKAERANIVREKMTPWAAQFKQKTGRDPNEQEMAIQQQVFGAEAVREQEGANARAKYMGKVKETDQQYFVNKILEDHPGMKVEDALKIYAETKKSPTAKQIDQMAISKWGQDRGINDPKEAEAAYKADTAAKVARAKAEVTAGIPKQMTSKQKADFDVKATQSKQLQDLIESAQEDVEQYGTGLLAHTKETMENALSNLHVARPHRKMMEDKFNRIIAETKASGNLSAERKAEAEALSLSSPTEAVLSFLKELHDEVAAKNEVYSKYSGAAAPKIEVGSVISHDGKNYRVKSLKADGTPDEVEHAQ